MTRHCSIKKIQSKNKIVRQRLSQCTIVLLFADRLELMVRLFLYPLSNGNQVLWHMSTSPKIWFSIKCFESLIRDRDTKELECFEHCNNPKPDQSPISVATFITFLDTYPCQINVRGTCMFPREDPGVKSRMCPPYPQRVVKGD